jgi:alpha-1,6-mannosyltransferase
MPVEAGFSALVEREMDRRIRTTGVVVLFAYIVQTIASYWLAPAQVAFWNRASSQIFAFFYPSLTGIGTLAALKANAHFLPVYCAPMLLATGCCALILLWLHAGEEPNASTANRLMWWSIAFAAANLPALPVMAQDLWISAAWGEMITHGLNPYYHDIPAQIATRWFPDHFLIRMTYGPLWALISAAVMLVTSNRWVVLVLFKAILGCFWLLALILTRRLTRDSDSRSQCLAVVMVGWLPASVGQSLAEGHNDIVMAALVMLWLCNRNAFGLAAAILVKYTAAPLALFTLIERRKPIELIGAAIFGAVALLLFFRGPGKCAHGGS